MSIFKMKEMYVIVLSISTVYLNGPGDMVVSAKFRIVWKISDQSIKIYIKYMLPTLCIRGMWVVHFSMHKFLKASFTVGCRRLKYPRNDIKQYQSSNHNKFIVILFHSEEFLSCHVIKESQRNFSLPTNTFIHFLSRIFHFY